MASFANQYFDAISNGQYTRSQLKTSIEAAHNVRINDSQLRQIRQYMKNEIFSDVIVTQKNGRTFVDFGDHVVRTAQIDNATLKSLEAGVSHLKGRQIDNLRKAHIKHLDDTVNQTKGLTWHHMGETGQFQQVPAGLHDLFKPHDGLVIWKW